MCKLVTLAANFSLRPKAPLLAMLTQHLGASSLSVIHEQCDNKRTLHEEQCDPDQDVPLVQPPERDRAIVDLAGRGQPFLVDAPTLELTPIEEIPVRGDARHRNARRRLSAQDSCPDCARVLPQVGHAIDVPANRAQPDVLINGYVHRGIGALRDAGQRLVRNEGLA